MGIAASSYEGRMGLAVFRSCELASSQVRNMLRIHATANKPIRACELASSHSCSQAHGLVICSQNSVKLSIFDYCIERTQFCNC